MLKKKVNCLFLILLVFILGCSDGSEEYKPSIFDIDSLLVEENVLYNDVGYRPIFRCPSACITNNKSVLIASHNQQIWDDRGDMDIVVARKKVNSNQWERMKIFVNTIEKGRYMSPIFLIDRLRGRIFIFASQFKDNNKYGYDHSSEDIDIVYKYSDDDGQSWSDQISLKDRWNLKKYTAVVTSASNGIVTSDGVFLVPMITLKDNVLYSSLLVKKENSDWQFSSCTPNSWDNECTVYVDNLNGIILDCRTNSSVRHKYFYNLDNDSYESIPQNNIGSNIAIKAEITRCTWKGKEIYLMTYPDTKLGIRENLSLYGSKDGTNWTYLYRFEDGYNGTGYSNVSVFQDKAIIVFETQGIIKALEISNIMDDAVLLINN